MTSDQRDPNKIHYFVDSAGGNVHYFYSANLQIQTGVKQSNAYAKRCSFRLLSQRWGLVHNLIPGMSEESLIEWSNTASP